MLMCLYRVLWWLVLPIVIAHRLWRDRKHPQAWRQLPERLGYIQVATTGGIWLHAVSLGEMRAAMPLITQLQHAYPQQTLTLSATTLTGRAQAESVTQAQVFFFPWDDYASVQRYLQRLQPRLILIMETEIWPHLLSAARRLSIPVMILNARLSDRSYTRYLKRQHSVSQLLDQVYIAAQSVQDGQRFAQLVAHPETVQVLGNLKFDQPIPEDCFSKAQQWRICLGTFPLWLVASTHQGEEALIINIFQQLRHTHPELRLLIAPRHPERFQKVAHACAATQYGLRTRSTTDPHTATHVLENHAIFLIDSIGELLDFYQVADMVTVGGSFVPIGGHNILEPALLAKPISFGPYMHNFSEITTLLLSEQAAVSCHHPIALADQIDYWLNNPQQRLAIGQRAAQTIASHKGATTRCVQWIDDVLNQTNQPH